MIVGGVLISLAFILYISHYPKQLSKGSILYYKEKWRSIDNYYLQ
jgi:hypothetical protein